MFRGITDEEVNLIRLSSYAFGAYACNPAELVMCDFKLSDKSFVGRKLANRLGYFFLDTDQQIEKQQGCTIEEIFRYAGEATFRDLETKLLENLQNIRNTILSTGGGMFVLSPRA